jgi:hypothetical protein
VTGGGSATGGLLLVVARQAYSVTPAGRAPVYGTRIHSEFRKRVQGLPQPGLATEISYLNGQVVPYGTAGAVRLDVVEGSPTNPVAIYDLKVGGTHLRPARIRQIRQHLPRGGIGVLIQEIHVP